MRTFLIVIDSFGVGELPDADKYGDVGSNTFVNTYRKVKFELPNMAKLGLYDIDGIGIKHTGKVEGCYAKLSEYAPAKDSTAGHYEISGIKLKHPYPVYPNAFPEKLIQKLEKACGIKLIGNEVASGTEIIARLGKQSVEEKCAIVYTSVDSVLQIACHNDVLDKDSLWKVCAIARKLMKGKHSVSRIIARPFDGKPGEFYRTEYRKDYALNPPKPTMLTKLKKKGYDVIGVGKIEDLFNFQGLTKSYHTRSNHDAIAQVAKLVREDFNGLMFANYNDTDMLYGHRNDPVGYANALVEIDKTIPDIIKNLHDDDLLLITADHGCDPTTASTDHSREYIPLLVYGKNLKHGVNLGTLSGFDNIAKAILDKYGVKQDKNSFLRKLNND